MIVFKKYLSYIFIFLGLIVGSKALPAVINKTLLQFNIKNTIGIDLTNCQTIGFSITANQFLYSLFLFACVCSCVGFILLFRKQKFDFKYNFLHISIILCLIIFCFYLLSSFMYIFLLMLEHNLFNKHIIYNLAFIIGCSTNIFVIILYCLIWFDSHLDNKLKVFYLLTLCLVSTHICIKMFSFIYLYGVIPSISGTTPEFYFDAFNYIFIKLGIGTLCMNENSDNPCQEYLIRMQQDCERAKGVKALPRIQNVGGPLSMRWIARLMNVLGTGYKTTTQHDCNGARKAYYDCIDFIGTLNKKNK